MLMWWRSAVNLSFFLCLAGQGRSPSGENREARVPKQSTGADRSVGARKARNGAGAKGSGQVVVRVETTGNRRMPMRTTDKPFKIEKRLVYEAYKAVKSKAGAAGVDGETIERSSKPTCGIISTKSGIE